MRADDADNFHVVRRTISFVAGASFKSITSIALVSVIAISSGFAAANEIASIRSNSQQASSTGARPTGQATDAIRTSDS
jgi:hypothetical protein